MRKFGRSRAALLGCAVCAWAILAIPMASAVASPPGPGRIGDPAAVPAPVVPALGNLAPALGKRHDRAADRQALDTDRPVQAAEFPENPAHRVPTPPAPPPMRGAPAAPVQEPPQADPTTPESGPTEPNPNLPPPAAPVPPAPTPAPEPVVTPEPVATPEPEPPSTARRTAQLLWLTNRARRSNGCRPLRVDPVLARTAQEHSDDMAARDYFSHTSLEGRTFDRRISDTGYHGNDLGENIAAGFGDTDEVQSAWMDSVGHRRNITDCAFTDIGIGYAQQGGFWTVDFGG